jgi:hypothetical protein
VQDLVVRDEVDLDVVAAAAHTDRHGSSWVGIPDRLNPIGWLAMISLSDPAAGMNQPSSGTPSRDGKVTSW